MSKSVLVIGGDHHNTLAILRSLGEKGVRSNLIVVSVDKNPYVSYSKYITKCKVVATESEIKDAMYQLHSMGHKDIVIACSDAISSYLDMNCDELSRLFILPGAKKQGSITEHMNKDVMSRVARDCGITIPSSWIVKTAAPMIDDIEFPCIIKPLISKDGSKSDIAICENRMELDTYLKNSHCDKLQIQRYIQKDIEFQLIGCSLDGGEQLIIPGASVILRQPQNTNTGFLRYLPKKKFFFNEVLCRNFLKRVDYSGLFSLEFLRDKDGKDYFMEINFRNDGNSICVTASGMNLPYIWYLYNSGLPIDSELNYDSMREVLVMPEFNDIGNIIHRRIGIMTWLKDIKNTDRFMEFSKYDQKPFWMYIFKKIFLK